jgi:type II secretory pathway component PulK
MTFDIGVGEALVLILVPLLILVVILTALYWVVRTAVRHGKQDAERDRVSRVQASGPDG